MNALRLLLLCHLRSFARDRGAFFWSFAFPAFFILIFGLVFGKSEEGNPRFAVGVAVADDSRATLEMVDMLKQIPVFEVKTGESDSLRKQLQDGKVRAVIVLPPSLERAAALRETATIDVFYDPANQTSRTVLGIVRQVLNGANQMMSHAPPAFQMREQPIQLSGNGQKRGRYIFFLLPGILAMSIMQLGLFSAVPTVIFREQGILKRLGATPLPRSRFALSQIIFRVVLGFLQTAWLLALGAVFFGFRVEGNLFLLVAFVALGVFTFTILGALLGSFAKTQETAMPIVQLVNFPFMFLSGIFFPIEMVPSFMQPVVNAIPTTYLANALRQISWGTAEWASLGLDAAVLAAWAAVGLALSFRFFRWE
jgi:ABC-2 type transport system permease protein